MTSRTYCDICKQEIKHNGRGFEGLVGRLHFSILVGTCEPKEHQGVKVIEPIDVCLPCVIKAINKDAQKVLKRPYHKKQVPLDELHNGIAQYIKEK